MIRSALTFVFVVYCTAMSSCGIFAGDNERVTVDGDFTSNLPLLVLELTDTDGTAQAVSGTMSLYDNADGNVGLQDIPKTVSKITARQRAGMLVSGKLNLSIQLVSGDGNNAEPLSLAGLPADTEWILHGSVSDKGMLRNGLSYALGRVLFGEDAPLTRFCEVLVRSGETYEYQGIHILAEDGLRIAQRLTGDREESFVVHYSEGIDRLSDDTVRLGNRLFADKTPQRNGDASERRRRIGVELAKLENALQSIRPQDFLAYESMLDQYSAIDLYILNSLMLNAFEAKVPFLLFKNGKGKLQFLPAWNFDYALDNQPKRDRPLPFEEEVHRVEQPSILERRLPVWRTLESGGDIRDVRVYPAYLVLGGERFLWFDRLFLSRSFLVKLYDRYHLLRRTVLSPQSVQGMVDNMTVSLGPALERDWLRWSGEYAAANGPYALAPFVDEEGVEHIRRTEDYGQDAVKIRRNIREQDSFLFEQMEQLMWMTVDLYDKGTAGNRHALYSIGVIAGLLALMHLLSRKL